MIDWLARFYATHLPVVSRGIKTLQPMADATGPEYTLHLPAKETWASTLAPGVRPSSRHVDVGRKIARRRKQKSYR